ncbi:ABC transporter substrate-binding protein [Bacillus sp. FSL K6-3431]|uniref:ABC transporter substrate-binding protein n=1 Tax=Bacillus sp. FSL K6-3431 TaxID=2921500 RepID=UPI0030F5F16F
MRKVFSLVMILGLTLFLVACGGKESASEDKLVIYSPNSEDIVNTIIPMFEKETGIKVELISAGTGELIKRISSETENPYADVMFGGSKAQALGYPELFERYVSKNNDDMLDDHKNTEGFLTPYIADGSVILVNTDLIGDIKVEGYEDLLNPELKGKIASADPASSSSAFAQLTNMLLAMGGDYTADKGWDYVTALIKNLDGKVTSGSGAVHKGVADGEYVVGLTYEDPSASYVRDGAPVKIVYPKEGSVFLDAGVEIVKGAKNLDNAKKFVDFIISKDAQDAFGTKLTNRPLRKDVKLGEHMTPLEDINIILEDEDYVKDNRDQLVEQYIDVFTSAQ